MSRIQPLKMVAKFSGTCGACKARVEAGSPIIFYRDHTRDRAWHVDCARAESLRRKLWAVGLKILAGDLDESHWRKVEAEMQAELAAIEARLDGANGAP